MPYPTELQILALSIFVTQKEVGTGNTDRTKNESFSPNFYIYINNSKLISGILLNCEY